MRHKAERRRASLSLVFRGNLAGFARQQRVKTVQGHYFFSSKDAKAAISLYTTG
jgi:hypothetical protein